MTTKQNLIKKSDLQRKGDLYANFRNISKEDKKKAINSIILNNENRNVTQKQAADLSLIWECEVTAWLEYFGIELS